MGQKIELQGLLSARVAPREARLTLFATVNLGLIEMLAHGLISASEAVNDFYFVENCLLVRRTLKHKEADRIMSHGVQLPDLFEALPTEQAHRQFLHELAAMKSLCLHLLESVKSPTAHAESD